VDYVHEKEKVSVNLWRRKNLNFTKEM